MDIEVFYKINSYLYDNKGIKQGNETGYLRFRDTINQLYKSVSGLYFNLLYLKNRATTTAK